MRVTPFVEITQKALFIQQLQGRSPASSTTDMHAATAIVKTWSTDPASALLNELALSIGMGSPFITTIVLPLAALLLLACLCYHLSIPTAIGLPIAGLVTGPHALGLVQDVELVHGIVELAALLLLFLAGNQCSQQRLAQLHRALPAGSLQIGLGIAVFTSVLLLLGIGWRASLFTGILVSLSSTTLARNLSKSRMVPGLVATYPFWNVLLLQNTFVVLTLLAIPMLAGAEETAIPFLEVFFTGVSFVTLTLLLNQRTVPKLLGRAAREHGREGFLLTALPLCLGVVLFAYWIGPGLAFGTFLAGLLVSESRYKGRLLSEVIPLRLICTLLFLVSLGALLDWHFLVARPLWILTVASLVLLCKGVLSSGSLALHGHRLSAAASAGLMMTPIGESAFLLFYAGRKVGLSPAGLGAFGEQTFIAASVLLIVIPFFMIRVTFHLGWLLQRMGLTASRRNARDAAPQTQNAAALDEQMCWSRPSPNANSDLRATSRAPLSKAGKQAPRLCVVTVEPEAPASGSSLRQLSLWKQCGVLVLAVWRGDTYLPNPPDSCRLKPNDRILLSACPSHLALSAPLFQSPPFGIH